MADISLSRAHSGKGVTFCGLAGHVNRVLTCAGATHSSVTSAWSRDRDVEELLIPV
jgi:hypothetical protein